MSTDRSSNTEKRNPSPSKNQNVNPLNVTNQQLFHMKPGPEGYVNIVPPYSNYSVALNCRCIGDVHGPPPDTPFHSRTYSSSPVQTGPTCSNAQNCASIGRLPLTLHTTKSAVSIGSTHSGPLKHDHQVKCVTESGAIVFLPSKDFRLEQKALDFCKNDMSQYQELWVNDHFHVYHPSYDIMELLSGTISTVMLMAAGVTSIPEDLLYWTAQYLECMKDYNNKHPYNINGILCHMLWLKRGDLNAGREEFKTFPDSNPGTSGQSGPSGGLDGEVVSPRPGEVDSLRTGSTEDIPEEIGCAEAALEGIDGFRGVGGATDVPLDDSATRKNASSGSSMPACFKGSAKSKEFSLSNKSPTVKYRNDSPFAGQDNRVDAGSQYVASLQNVAYPVELNASQKSGILYNAQAVTSPYNPLVSTSSMNSAKVASPRTGSTRIGSFMTGSPITGNQSIVNTITGRPRSGSPRICSLMVGIPTAGNPEIGNPATGSPRSSNSRIDSPTTRGPRTCNPRIVSTMTGISRTGSPRTGSSRTGSPRTGSPSTGSPRTGNSRNDCPNMGTLKSGSKRTAVSVNESPLIARAQFPDQRDQSNENIPEGLDNFKRQSSNTSNNSRISKSSRVSRKSQVSYSNKVSHRSPDRFNYD